MPIGFQKSLNSFHFERTVNWRVRFPGLSELIGGEVADAFNNNEFFAKSVTMPTSMVEIVDDPQLVGFFQSKLVQPTLSVEIYTDDKGHIEDALRIWNRAAFTNDGYMPTPFGNDPKTYAAQAVQKIIINKIDPINIDEVKASFNSVNKAEKTSVNYNLTDSYVFYGYLSKLPDYNGNDSASIRTIGLTIKVVSMQMVQSRKLEAIEDRLYQDNTNARYEDRNTSEFAKNHNFYSSTYKDERPFGVYPEEDEFVG